MELNSALWLSAGVILFLLFLQVMAGPLEIAVRTLGNSLAGGAAIWVLNLVGSPLGLEIGLNPVSAVIVGVLGLPGIIALSVSRVLLG